MQLVAPAGSYSCLRAALNAGADAVYLGLPLFGARAKAENFSLETLKDNIDLAHLYGTKVFITLNTLIKDGEMGKAVDMAKFAYDCGADAAIVQDIRYIKALKKALPRFPLHASTQMGIHNKEGALALSDMGIRRAVLSRETLPEDIADIKSTGIEIEFFVQGALCICFSGNCYFSSLASSYSGNRGKCMQLCRKPYIFEDKRGYFLSAKDICLYDRLGELEALGVDAIKIEGRMRSEEYVSQAVRVYKSNMPHDKARDALKAVFNRGDYCSAYLDKDAPFNVIYARSQANIGKFVGKIDKVSEKRLFLRGFSPNAGDGYKVMRDGVEVCGASEQGGVIVGEKPCKPGDELHRTFDGALSKELRAIEKRLPVKVKVMIKRGEYPAVDMHYDGINVCVRGDELPQDAISRAIDCDTVRRAFEKTSEHPFAPDIEITLDGGLFMPVSALNELRRISYGALRDKIVKDNTPRRDMLEPYALKYNALTAGGVMLMIENERQLSKEALELADYIVINPRDYNDFCVPDIDKPVLLNVPVTMRGRDRDIIKRAIDRDGIYGVISNNMYTLKLTDKPILLGTGHNIIGESELPHITSYESDSIGGGFTYVFGYAPAMTLCHCPHEKCVNCSGNDMLTDESGRVFKMRRYKAAHCYWQLLNCVPHDLTDKDIKNRFYDCSELSASDIVKVLRGQYSGERTRGNTNKGLK